MHRCRFVLPVTLFDGTHPEDWDFIDFKFLIREEQLEHLPNEKSSFNINLTGEGNLDKLECVIADVTRLEDEGIVQILLHPKQLHINYWRYGVKAMFDCGWQWAALRLVSPPQDPAY